MQLQDLTGKKVVGWGAGVDVTATIEAAQPIAAAVSFAQDDQQDGPQEVQGVRAFYGEAAMQELLAADVVIKSPGISPREPLYKQLESKGVHITTSANLWLAAHADKTIGVTGSKGKSTTSSLIAHLLGVCGKKTELAGNIGVPFFSLSEDAEMYVLELSSYQCESLTVSPKIGVFTSLFSEHIAWHGSEESYFAAKLNMVQHGVEKVVANGENEIVTKLIPTVVDESKIAWAPSTTIEIDNDGVRYKGELLASTNATKLKGRHNLVNMGLALAVLEEADIDIAAHSDALRAALQGFSPLEHRLEEVGEHKGLTWVNDSLSSNPQATIAALEAYKDVPVTILLGGFEKHLSYEPLRAYLASRQALPKVITMPDNGDSIAAVLASVDGLSLTSAPSMKEAMKLALQSTPKGGVVLLSPAAPSFGRFKNYADRGNQFKQFAQEV